MEDGSPTAPPPRRRRGARLLRDLRFRDHTRGSLLRSLFLLSVPLVTTSLSSVAFQLADLGFISRLGEDAVTAVVVSNQTFRQIVMIIVMGAGFGAQSIISRLIGDGRLDDAEHVAGQVVTGGFLFSLVIAVLGISLAEPMLALMNTSPEVRELGVPYLRLAMALHFGFVFVILFQAVLNGAGDATTPMVIAIMQSLVSLVFEWALIFGRLGLPELGVAGVAWGQGSGQLVCITLSLSVLLRGRSRVHVRLRHLVPDPRVMLAILGMAWAPALQMAGSFLVNAYFLILAGDFGPKAQAAYSIGMRISMVGPMFAFPIAGAAATLVGQNLGAGSVPRAWRALWTGLAVHAGLLVTIAAVLAFGRDPILGAFTDDPEVLRIGRELVLYQAGAFVFFSVYFVLFRALQGAGEVLPPMVLSVVNSVAVTLPLGWYLATRTDAGPTGLFVAMLVGAGTVTVALALWTLTGRWTRRVPQEPPPG